MRQSANTLPVLAAGLNGCQKPQSAQPADTARDATRSSQLQGQAIQKTLNNQRMKVDLINFTNIKNTCCKNNLFILFL